MNPNPNPTAITTEITTATITATPATDPDALAAFLAEAPPSAGELDALPLERLSIAGCVAAVVAWDRLLRHAQAGLIAARGSLARDAAAGDPQ